MGANRQINRPDKERLEKEPENEPEKLPEKVEPVENSLLDEILGKPQESLIPWEKATLPSGGVYYSGQVPNGEVEVRGWGIQTDKILATARLAQTGQSIDHLLKNCVRLPNDFDHMNLLIGDRMFLLYYLRGITYGREYEFLVECNNEECGNTWTETYDINLLAKTITGPNPVIGLEPFVVPLPYFSSVLKKEFTVKVRLLRGYDLEDIMRRKRVEKKLRPTARNRVKAAKSQERKVTQEVLDKTIEDNLRLVIVEAGGDSDREKIEELVSRMHSRDTATIREFLRVNTPGIDPSIEVTCPECNSVMVMDLPITESFFRPTVGRLPRE
jgi:enamine deaminase RidA (YjgF/YER057c/UK114 family)